jgi:hypothetical protein
MRCMYAKQQLQLFFELLSDVVITCCCLATSSNNTHAGLATQRCAPDTLHATASSTLSDSN